MSAPASLQIVALFNGSHCDWRTFSKIKVGPRARHWCATCGLFAKQRVCGSINAPAKGNS